MSPAAILDVDGTLVDTNYHSIVELRNSLDEWLTS
jgi:beta-phosphoglucomutase-like phosphatase (HAD superfamily)